MSTPVIPEVDYAQARHLMRDLFRNQSLDVGVFVDRGWGDSPLNITVIVDGNGQTPVARLSRQTYQQLLENKVIAPNTLQTYKARRFHQFQGSTWQHRVMEIARSFPKLTALQQESVRRATLRLTRQGLSRRAKPSTADARDYVLTLPAAGLKLAFGYNDWNGRYLREVAAV